MLRVEGMDALAEERDREVRAILQSINDLGQVMKDLSVLVIDQGTILDRIDANMDAVRPAVSASQILRWQGTAVCWKLGAASLEGQYRRLGSVPFCNSA